MFILKKRPNKIVQVILSFSVTILFGLIYFYFNLPAINLQNPDFYIFCFLLAAVYFLSRVIFSGTIHFREVLENKDSPNEAAKSFFSTAWRTFKIPAGICAALVVVFIVGNVLSWEVIRAGEYQKLLKVDTGDFISDVKQTEFNSIPLLDRDSAQRLANRKLGDLSDMVSQFEVSETYNTQINYNGRPVRVTPLEYGDIIKWFNNRSKGLPAYMIVDMITQNAEVVRLENGMKYTPDEYFGRYLQRHLRFNYPTFMFDTPVFEVNDAGEPYWICPRIVKTIGLFGGTDVNGAVMVNAVTGETQYHEKVPEWVDHLYSADLIIEQYDYHGTYVNGFINSILGQKDVTVTTKGYNYIAQNDDVYVYTGVTSVGTDQSNIGFILTNQRTKETTFYKIAGAEEYSAMASAEGVVQHLNYRSTFPLLLNVHNQPTYFMALKDDAGLVKQYAMVNVQQYQIVSTGASVVECSTNYATLLRQHSISAEDPGTEISGSISEIRSAVIESNSVYYIRLDASPVFYELSASKNPSVVIMNVGDNVSITHMGDNKNGITTGILITKK